jgi:uncharacterized Zn finger protein (UPF0148 family)
MSDVKKRDDTPVEIYCPICGYTTAVKETDHHLEGLSRQEKIEAIKALQESDQPIVVCKGCDDPKQTARIMEVR